MGRNRPRGAAAGPDDGQLKAAAIVPRARQTGILSIAFGFGAAWLTNYDLGTLTQVRAPGTPP